MYMDQDLDDTLEEQQADAKAKAVARVREIEDFKWFMGSRQGRRVMWKLLSEAGVFRTPHQIGAQSEDNAFRAGMQYVGQMQLAEIHALCPEQYNQMMMEQMNATRTERT